MDTTLDKQTVDSFARRLNVAKSASGNMSMQRISDATGIAASDISTYLSGKVTPTFQARRMLAKALAVPSVYLTRAWPVAELISHRDRRKLTQRDRQRIRIDIEIAFGNYYNVEDVLEEPQPSAGSFGLHELSQLPTTIDEVECIASNMRAELGIGTHDCQPDIHAILDAKIRLLPFDAPSEAAQGLMDGCVVKSGRGDKAIAFCKDVSVDRQRFTLAHELGHLLTDDEFDEVSSDQFASAFLMPRDLYEREFESHSLDALLGLKGKFGCSIAALNRRGRELELIPEQDYIENQMRLSYRGWRKREPDPYPPLQEPQYGRYSDLCVKAWQRELISVSKLFELLGDGYGNDS